MAEEHSIDERRENPFENSEVSQVIFTERFLLLIYQKVFDDNGETMMSVQGAPIFLLFFY
jgi:hypothetical protein